MLSSSDEFPNGDFFPDIDELFGNLNMGDNTNTVATTTNANAGPHVFMSFLF
jgi:hypothetical protein